jgi:hypothetical protein
MGLKKGRTTHWPMHFFSKVWMEFFSNLNSILSLRCFQYIVAGADKNKHDQFHIKKFIFNNQN